MEVRGKAAEIITLDMTNDYSLSKLNYNFKDKSGNYRITEDDFLLKPYDIVSVRPSPFFTIQKKVTIVGEVFYPGSYTIISPRETVSDLIKRSGGLRPSAYLIASSFSRKGLKVNLDLSDIIKNKNSKNDFILEDGDIISIAKSFDLITIAGEINVPGNYKYIKNDRLNDVLKKAGGLSRNADKTNIIISYPNGISKRKTFLSNPKIKDGSSIIIGSNIDKEKIDKTELLKEISSITANIFQVISIYLIAIKA